MIPDNSLLPTYDAIGLWAPVLLVTLRFLPGFALGGESIGALLLTVEVSPSDKRGLFAALIQASGQLAIIAASFAVAAVSKLPETALLSWDWRIPFLVSIVLVIIGTYVRTRVEESAKFATAVKEHAIVRVPVAEILKRYRKLVLLGVCRDGPHRSPRRPDTERFSR